MKVIYRVFLVFFCFSMLGCSPKPSEDLDNLPEPSSSPVIVTSALTPNPTMPPVTNEPGIPPKLAIITPNGLWTIGANGMGLSKVVEAYILAPQDTTAMPAPSGGFAAYITGDSRLRDLTLNIIHLARGLAYSIPLASEEYAIQEDSVQGDPEVEAARAVVEQTSIAWAPDGSQLAFMGMREGPSSNLYTFLTNDFWVFTEEQAQQGIQTTRWTDGPDQGITPIWSPDGRYIVYAGVNSLGTGAGYDMARVWAVDVQEGTVISLYEPEGSAETFVGWADADTFLVHSWKPDCGNERLRLVDVPTGRTQMIWEGAFNGVALASEIGNRALLISTDQYTAECKGNTEAGLFLLFAPQYLGLESIVEEEAFLPVWSPEGELFFARTAEHVYAIKLAGDEIIIRPLEAPMPTLPSTSNGATRLVWASQQGVWVGGLDIPPVQIFSSAASLPAVSPDGQTVFFIAEEGLFIARAPGFVPQVVGEGLIGTGAFWVNP